jgi:hypothetical protein
MTTMYDTQLCEYFDRITFSHRKSLTRHLRLDKSILSANDAESLSVVEVAHEDQPFIDVRDHQHTQKDHCASSPVLKPLVTAIKNNISLAAPRNLDSRKRRKQFNFGNGKYEGRCPNLIIPPPSISDIPMSPSSPVTDQRVSKDVIKNILDGIMKKRSDPKKSNKMLTKRKNRFMQSHHILDTSDSLL